VGDVLVRDNAGVEGHDSVYSGDGGVCDTGGTGDRVINMPDLWHSQNANERPSTSGVGGGSDEREEGGDNGVVLEISVGHMQCETKLEEVENGGEGIKPTGPTEEPDTSSGGKGGHPAAKHLKGVATEWASE
jgi:hypothetical protein